MNAYVSYSLTSDEVYNDEGDVIGENEYVLIEKLWVTEEQRGNGIGRKILTEALVDIAAEHPGVDVKVAALPFDNGLDMADLVAFYESVGFEVENCDGSAVVMILN